MSKEGSFKSIEVDCCCSDGVDKLVRRREMRDLSTLSEQIEKCTSKAFYSLDKMRERYV